MLSIDYSFCLVIKSFCLRVILIVIQHTSLSINLYMQSSTPHPLLSQYHHIKQQLDLPLKLRLYLSSLQNALDKKQPSSPNKQQVGNPLFVHAFAKQSDSSMANFLTQLITHLHARLTNPVPLPNPHSPTLIAQIETTAQLQTFYFGVPRWLSIKFRLDPLRKQLQIHNKKRNITLELQHYFIRHSQKHKNTMVCQAISKQISEQVKHISLYFEEQVYQHVFRQVSQCFFAIRKEEVLRMANRLDTTTEEEKELRKSQSDPANVILSSATITNYLHFKASILAQLQGNLMFKAIKYLPQCQAQISRSTKNSKMFRLQFPSTMPAAKMRALFLHSLHNTFKYRLESNQLQHFSKRYSAVYDSYLLGGRICEQISIKQQSESYDLIHFSQGVETVMTSQHVQFMCVRVVDVEGESRVMVVIGVKIDKLLTQDVVVGLLLQCREMLYRTHNEMKVEEEEEFFSIIDMGQEVVVELGSDQQYNSANDSAILKRDNSSLPQSHLYQKHLISPAKLNQPQLQALRMKQHFLLKQWVRCKHGGVMCVRESLAEQRKMIRKVATSIGANLFKLTKNGGIVNISLPVIIFKKQSHLQSIANNFSYAPLLFDKKHNDVLARFKKCIVFTLSMANLAISSEKPFNPILGETMQGVIGGCPVYVQQISHHPPISAYYFQGRTFKVYGYIEPKIGFYSLNSGKCWTQKPTTIEFDDGSKVLLSNPKMIIKGLIFGDRQFHYQDKTYIYDTANHYFAELNFGPKKRGFYYRSDPQDYVHGKIYRTTSAYLAKFKKHCPPEFPAKEDIAVDLGTIEGIWSQGLRINGEQIWNFANILPYKMQEAHNPLPSDSRLRRDLSQYIEGNIDAAQEEKQLMEQAQRRDRMLREKQKQK